jgi:hypothetical protein
MKTKKPKAPKPALPKIAIGWREWIALPELGLVGDAAIKAKIDTGARTSALHAVDLEFYRDGDRAMVAFTVHPRQRHADPEVRSHAEVVDEREVRSSSGAQELRPVIRTPVDLGGRRWPIEITLTRRDLMGFRMLLGRQALRRHTIIDPGGSFLAPEP